MSTSQVSGLLGTATTSQLTGLLGGLTPTQLTNALALLDVNQLLSLTARRRRPSSPACSPCSTAPT